jgi:hypothetical protein
MVISLSPLVFAQFVEHHVPQVVQRFSKLNRVDQGPAAPVVPVQPVQALARDQKTGDAFAVGAHPHFGQVAAVGQQKNPSEDVRGLEADQIITPFAKKSCQELN